MNNERKYYAIYSNKINTITGTTSDFEEVVETDGEDSNSFIEITKSEFDSFDELSENPKYCDFLIKHRTFYIPKKRYILIRK